MEAIRSGLFVVLVNFVGGPNVVEGWNVDAVFTLFIRRVITVGRRVIPITVRRMSADLRDAGNAFDGFTLIFFKRLITDKGHVLSIFRFLIGRTSGNFTIYAACAPQFFRHSILHGRECYAVGIDRARMRTYASVTCLNGRAYFGEYIRIKCRVRLFGRRITNLCTSMGIFPFVLRSIRQKDDRAFTGNALIIRATAIMDVIARAFVTPRATYVMRLTMDRIRRVLNFNNKDPVEIVHGFIYQYILRLITATGRRGDRSNGDCVFS